MESVLLPDVRKVWRCRRLPSYYYCGRRNKKTQKALFQADPSIISLSLLFNTYQRDHKVVVLGLREQGEQVQVPRGRKRLTYVYALRVRSSCSSPQSTDLGCLRAFNQLPTMPPVFKVGMGMFYKGRRFLHQSNVTQLMFVTIWILFWQERQITCLLKTCTKPCKIEIKHLFILFYFILFYFIFSPLGSKYEWW